MTRAKRPRSSRDVLYAKFGKALRDALISERRTQRWVADELGISIRAASDMIMGYRLPYDERVSKLAQLLNAPDLITITAEYQTFVCVVCGASFTALRRGRTSMFCSEAHRVSYWNDKASAKKVGTNRKELANAKARVLRLETMLAQVQETLTATKMDLRAFCLDCEWDGVCKDVSCKLHPRTEHLCARECDIHSEVGPSDRSARLAARDAETVRRLPMAPPRAERVARAAKRRGVAAARSR